MNFLYIYIYIFCYFILPLHWLNARIKKQNSAHNGGRGGGGGEGEGGNICDYTIIEFSKADLTELRKACCDRLYFTALASFQLLGKANNGNLLVVEKWCAGTYKLSAFRRSRSGLRFLFETHISLKDIGSLL